MFFHMQNKTRNLLGSTLFLFAILLGGFFFLPKTLWEKPSDTQSQEEVPAQIIHATLLVQTQSYSLVIPSGTSLLEAMQTLDEKQADFTFTGTDSSLGYYIESINGVASDPATSSYWMLYHNGEMAGSGVSELILDEGDVISWNYEHIEYETGE